MLKIYRDGSFIVDFSGDTTGIVVWSTEETWNVGDTGGDIGWISNKGTCWVDVPDDHEYFLPKERFNPAKEAAKQVGGNHYQMAIQPIDYILENKLGYCEGNVVKYVTRHDKKNGAEDIKKAIHYLEFILKDKYGIDTTTTEG